MATALPERDDAALVALAQAGDGDAFGLLAERHRGRLYGLAFRIVRDPDDAQDATSEALLLAWRAFPRFDASRARVGQWFTRIVVNVSLSLVRHRRVIREVCASALLTTVYSEAQARRRREDGRRAGDVVSPLEYAPDPEPGPEELALTREANREVRPTLARGIRALPIACATLPKNNQIRPAMARRALAAELIYGVVHPDGRAVRGGERSGAVRAIAAADGIGYAAAKSRLSRARMALRAAVELTGGWDGIGGAA